MIVSALFRLAMSHVTFATLASEVLLRDQVQARVPLCSTTFSTARTPHVTEAVEPGWCAASARLPALKEFDAPPRRLCGGRAGPGRRPRRHHRHQRFRCRAEDTAADHAVDQPGVHDQPAAGLPAPADDPSG